MYGGRGLALRLVYLGCAMLWYVTMRWCTFMRQSVVVLCYHGVSDDARSRFAWQMRHIRDRAVSVEELWDNNASFDSPRVCVTFDDAFANLLRNALSEMQVLGIPATVFAVTENLGEMPKWYMPSNHPEEKETVMSGVEIINAWSSGLMRIGSHTATHARLTDLTCDCIQQELKNSKIILEKLVGVSIVDLALPYGMYDASILSAAECCGYARIFTLDEDLVNAAQSKRVLGRFLMSPKTWRIEFMLTIRGGYSWLGGWRRLVRRCREMTAKTKRKE